MRDNGIYFIKAFLIALVFTSVKSFAQVSVTPATGGMNLCVGNTNYTTLGNIVISEGANAGAEDDFFNDNTSRTYVLSAPTNFQFQPGTGTVSPNAGAGSNDFSGAVNINVTANTITLTYTVNGNARSDAFTISGIRVRATAPASFGYILRTGGDALQIGNTVGDARNHGTLFSIVPPIVSLTDNDADNIVCTSGSSNITFNAYGATTYEFFVDGASQGGPSGTSTLNYNWNNTVGSPHSIHVVGTANGCSVQSSTINISVTQSPTMNWTPLYQSFALSDGNVAFDTNGTYGQNPMGGNLSFSGPGVSSSGSNYVFSPSAAGSGTHQVTANYTQSGCSVSDMKMFSVNAVNAISGLNTSYCIYDGGSNLTISPAPKITYGYLYYNWNILGYSFIPNQTYYSNNYNFVPEYFSTIAGGLSQINYGIARIFVYYSDGTLSPQVETYVYPRPTVTLFPVGGSNQLCNNGAPIPLIISPADNGNGQTWVSGSGVVENPNGSGNWFLNPNAGGTGNRTITYQYRDNASGCENTSSQIVTVNPPPTAAITDIFDPVGYCTNSNAFALQGTPVGGTFSGPGTFSNYFYPYYNTTIGSNTITYTYTDGNGCSDSETRDITIFNAPSVSIRMVNSDTSLCLPELGSGTYTLEARHQGPATDVVWQAYDGSVYAAIGNSGTFAPAAPSPGFNAATAFTNSAYQATEGIAYIQAYTTGQPAACPAAYSYGYAFMIPKPTITITNLTKLEYCTAEPNFALAGKTTYFFPDYNNFPLNSNTGAVTDFVSVSSPSDPAPNPALASPIFQPSSALPGDHIIRWTYTDLNGCNHFKDTTITINENPVADFVIDSGRCATKNTFFNSSASYLPPSTTVYYKWDFGDGTTLADTSDLPDPQYRYMFPGGYPVSLTLQTSDGCSNTKALTGANLLTIQSIPVSDFDYRFQCLGDLTQFDTLSVVQTGAFKSRTWIFADEFNNPFDSIYQTVGAATSYTFANAKSYRVTVVDSTTLGCTDRKRRTLFILPYITPTVTSPYAISFKDSSGNWGESGIRSTWVHDIPIAAKKALMYRGGQGITDSVWVTNSDSLYNYGEKSHLNSPCFNFSQLEKPMISIKLWTATQEQIAGAVLNSSTDNGISWNTIGRVGDGVAWYNTIGIAGSPGTISTNDGWSGVDTAWRIAKIGLPTLANFNPAQKIRFRIVFGSPGDSTIARSEGIAIDSVWIGNKNKVLLMEHFTNYNTSSGTTTPSVIAAENVTNIIRDTRAADVATLYYHTSFPSTDAFNNYYPEGPSSRVLYHGVSSAPRTVLDGNYYNGNVYSGGTSEARLELKDVDARTLETAIFNLDLTTDFRLDTVFVGTRIKYTGKIPLSRDIILHTVVTEDDSSGVVKYASIVRQMLPDAAGNYINKTWLTDDELHYTNSWIHNLPASSKLGVVTFVQDAITREVYQAAYLRGSGSLGDFVADVQGEEKSGSIKMFPNPASDEVFVIFGKASTENIDWEVLDNIGRKVDQGICTAGKDGFSINLAKYAGGVYHVKIRKPNGEVDHKELVVVH